MKAATIAYIGDADSVLGFRALGVEAVVPSGPEEAVRSFRSLVAGGVSVIVVVEDYLDWLADEIEQTAKLPVPAVVVLPGLGGSKGRGGDTIRRQITKAVGVDLMVEDR
jgi:V/A-type H+-transporting ATPase subunit F